MILSKLSRYKSVCDTIKQLRLLSLAKCFKKSNTIPDVSLSSVEITSSIDNMLIDGNLLFNNLNKLQRTTKSTRVSSPSDNDSGVNSTPSSLRCGSNLVEN